MSTLTHHFATEFQTNCFGESRFVCDCGQQGRWCFGRREAISDHLKHKIHQRRIGNMAEEGTPTMKRDQMTTEEKIARDKLSDRQAEVSDVKDDLKLVEKALDNAESCETAEDFDANLFDAINTLDSMRTTLTTLRKNK